ncbi:hypothetical protein ACFE04_003557 [Oxalis oulophora]
MSVNLTTLVMVFGNLFSSQPSVLEIPLGVAFYIALVVFWELAMRLHKVILAQRLELASTEPLLLALDKSILGSFRQYCTYRDLCMLCENYIDYWMVDEFYKIMVTLTQEFLLLA